MKITQLTKLALVIFALGGLAACSSTSEDAAADSSQTEQTTNTSSESGQSAAEAAAAAAEERARRSALATRVFYFDFDVSEFRGSDRDVLTYHARDLAATRGEIAGDVAHVLGGRHHLDVHDRLE